MHSKNDLQAEFDRLYQIEDELLFDLRDGRGDIDELMRDLTIVGDKLEALREQLSGLAVAKDKEIIDGKEEG